MNRVSLTLFFVVVFCDAFMCVQNAENANTVRYSEASRSHDRNTRDIFSGACGEHLTWTVEDSLLTISGTGIMDNYADSNSTPWADLRFIIQTIVVEEGVTSIGDFAFSGCVTAHVSLPNSLKSIGTQAFRGSNLKNITIPANVVSIEGSAFMGCYYLSLFEVCEGNSKYRSVDGVLYDHDLTTIVQFPSGKDVSSYTVESGVTTIGNSAFDCARVTSITLPDNLLLIEDSAFRGCSNLTSFNIPDKVESIGNNAFSGCYSLASIILGDGLKSIGDYAFSSCWALTTITIPVNVKTIGFAPFQDCSGLNSIEVANGNNNFASLYGVLFDKNYSQLIQYPSGYDSTSYTIPSCVTSIYDYAFSHSAKLTNVNILDGVKTIGNHCFDNCYKLVTVTISSSVESIGESAFEYCNSLRSVSIPSNVKRIGKSAFSGCNELKDVIISDGVKSIGESAFSYCVCLTSISIPKSVEFIGDDAFYQCYGLTSIDVSSGNPKYASIDGVLYDHEHTILIEYPAQSDRSTYTIPSGVKTIGHGAFYNSKRLVNVSIPDSVISIEDDSFYDCSNLKNVDIGNGVKSIGNNAFSNCGLTSITIPDSVESIGVFAFSSTAIRNVTIPDSVRTIGDSAFSFCNSLEIVNIPDSIESIGSFTFSYTDLRSVFYQGSIDFSTSNTFTSCPHLDTLCVSPDYKYPTFCGINVTSSSRICEEFQSNFSHCFKATYIDGGFVQEKRRNATGFESRTNECIEFECNNESGALWWSKCKNSEEVVRMCIDDECVENPNNEEGWSVVLEMDDDVNPSDFNSNDVKNSVSAVTGIKETDLSVGIEVDENGFIVRVVVIFTKDESDADKIARKVEQCIGKASSSFFHGENEIVF